MNEYRRRWHFENGYGASVIRNHMSIGYDQGLYELAVLQNDRIIYYESPITDSVIGNLTPRQVAVLLKQIKEF